MGAGVSYKTTKSTNVRFYKSRQPETQLRRIVFALGTTFHARKRITLCCVTVMMGALAAFCKVSTAPEGLGGTPDMLQTDSLCSG